jgi:DNA processing protein
MKPKHDYYLQEELLACLSFLENITSSDLWFLSERFKSITELLKNPPPLPEDLSISTWNQLQKLKDISPFKAKLDEYYQNHVTPIIVDNPQFLPQLASIPNFPPIYWLKEDLNPNYLKRAVAIVGSSDASSYGMQMSWMMGKYLSENGYFVISGGALGIDMGAHFGALASDFPTLVILPNGMQAHLDKTAYKFARYESETKAIIFSQFPPNEPWLTENALTRNLTIASLAQAVVVIEAKGWRSGTMSTVNHAKRLGKPIFVAPSQENFTSNWAFRTLPEKRIAIPLNSYHPCKELIEYLIDLHLV